MKFRGLQYIVEFRTCSLGFSAAASFAHGVSFSILFNILLIADYDAGSFRVIPYRGNRLGETEKTERRNLPACHSYD